MFVKPATRPATDDAGTPIAGVPEVPLTIRGPDRHLLRSEGQEVPNIDFWHRMVRDGDVVVVNRPAVDAEPEPVAEA